MMRAEGLRDLIEEVIKQISISMRNITMYTITHPASKKSISKANENLQKILNETEELTLSHIEGRLLANEVLLNDKIPTIDRFSSDMRKRHMRSVTFSRGLKEEELEEFINLMMVKPEELLEQGPFSQHLSKKGVSRIKVNEFRYTIVGDEAERREDTLITNFLLGRISDMGIGMEEVLKEILTDSDRTARLLSTTSREEPMGKPPLDPSQRAQVFTQNLERIINELLIGRAGGWRQFKKNLVHMILGLDAYTQLEVLRRNIQVDGKEEEVARLFRDDIPDEKLAELIATEGLRSDTTPEESKAFIKKLVPDSKKRRELLPSVEKKLEEYGISKEEFIELLKAEEADGGLEEGPIDEEVHSLIKKAQLDSRDLERLSKFARRLSKEGRGSETKILINKFFRSLNSPDQETRKEVARLMPEVFGIIESMAGEEGTLRTVIDYVRRKLWSEKDSEVFIALSDSLLEMGKGMIQEGKYEIGLSLMELSSKSVEERGLPPDYLNKKQEAIREIIENKDIINAQVEIIRDATGGDLRSAVNVLKILGKDAVNALIGALAEEPHMSKRMRLIRAIIEMGKEAIPPLKQALVANKWYVVRNAVMILGEIKDEGSIKQIGAMLKHEEPRVRKEAIQALLNIGSKKVGEMIIECLDDEDEGVRTKAIEALTSLRSMEAIPKLMDLSRRGSGLFGARETSMRIKAIKALGTIRAEAAIPLLSDLLSKKGFLSKAEPEEIRRNAVLALGAIGGERAIKVLEDVSRSDSNETIRLLSDKIVKRIKGGTISLK